MADVLVIVATGLAWWSLVPQIVKLIRTGDTSGVSNSWPAIGLVTNAGWTAYLGSRSLWAAMPSTAVMTVTYGLVLWALHRSGRPLTRSAAVGGVWAAVLTITLWLSGWPGLGLALAGSYVVHLTPAVTAAYRSSRPTGISPGTWGSIVIETALWGAYGYLNHDVPVMLYACAGVIGGSAILIRYWIAVARSDGDNVGAGATSRRSSRSLR